MSDKPNTLDSYTLISDLGQVVKRMLDRGVIAIGVVISLIVAVLFFNDNPGWAAILWMGAGTVVTLKLWHTDGIGLPILPMFAIQHFLAFGIPIITNNERLQLYPVESQTQAGIQVCIFLAALTAAWRFGMQVFYPRQTMSYVLKAFSGTDKDASARMGVILIISVSAYTILQSMRLIEFVYELLPNGTYSLVTPVIKASTMAGFFIIAMQVGANQANLGLRLFFWMALLGNALILASGFLLSSATNLMAAVTVGLFWSSGKLPWRFIATALAILSFLHLGKFDMRERYWGGAEGATFQPGLTELPAYYGEWMSYSYGNIFGFETKQAAFGPDKKKSASMLERVDNMQNLLFAIKAVDGEGLPLLKGATYALIPPLLIPRILWPEKPRAHEGQVMLNVHFGRQVLNSTFTTYVAWGLLPEAYGNFGAIWGAVLLGLVIGFFAAWVENTTVTKPLLSLEGLVTFALFIELTVSFEYVASVLITALFQSLVIISLACSPFVTKSLVVRPVIEEAETP